jgi:hypothetical protein
VGSQRRSDVRHRHFPKFDEELGRRYDLNLAELPCLSFLWQTPQSANVNREVRFTPAAGQR